MAETTSARPEPDFTIPSSPQQDVAVGSGRRRRRPSGEPPPLPKELGRSGRLWAYRLGVVLLLWALVVLVGIGRQFDWAEMRILRQVVRLRTDTADDLFRRLQALGSPEVLLISRWAVLVVVLVSRRFRHLLVFLSCVLITTLIGAGIAYFISRPRPMGVEILGSWAGFSHPSRPLADMAVVLVGAIYAVVPRGRWRDWAKVVAGLYLGVLGVTRLYLAVDHPSDSIIGVILGAGITFIAFRLFAPTDAFPISYRRGAKGAHLDVGGRRGEAIELALREQLGLDVVSVKPFGLDGSAGSTPLRITLAEPPGTALFGKLYAKTHLRADRSYKLLRTLLYGRLEDESTFSTVRRLVQYEDYLLHLMVAGGIPTAKPYGFVEITPEREYLLVTEFFDGAQEIGKATVDEAVIDDGLAVIRRLWDGGLAHRDVKPANVLVRDGKVMLIDVAFAEVRPSPWRQAVDLANMMLVLALRTDPDTVYRRAQRVFTPEEIGEAFAATRGITLTSQLRAQLRQDGRDLVSRFRELAPPCRSIRIQYWSLRRVGLTAAVLAGGTTFVVLTIQVFSSTRLL